VWLPAFHRSREFACCFATEEMRLLEEMFKVFAKSKIGVREQSLGNSSLVSISCPLAAG
jgi:hypothetical protein